LNEKPSEGARSVPPAFGEPGRAGRLERVRDRVPAYDMLNPATTRNLRAPGAKRVLPGWADDECGGSGFLDSGIS